MLSFSTHGSAQHPKVDKVRRALALTRERAPGLAVEGELQADAALVPAGAQKKGKTPSLGAGDADVLLFPGPDAANFRCKLTQWLCAAQGPGPLPLPSPTPPSPPSS